MGRGNGAGRPRIGWGPNSGNDQWLPTGRCINDDEAGGEGFQGKRERNGDQAEAKPTFHAELDVTPGKMLRGSFPVSTV